MEAVSEKISKWSGLPETSIWSDSVKDETPKSAGLAGDRQTDVLVIGAGMAGILTAWRLKQAGVSCIVAEAKRVGSGITRNTTAKITAQHGLIYDQLIHQMGMEKAQSYYRANMQAVLDYRDLAEVIPCHFEERTAYVYSLNDKAKLEREAAAYEKLAIHGKVEENIKIPIRTAGGIRMENQGQFNPLELITALSKDLDIVENTFVQEIDGNRAITDHGVIQAEHIVLATHFPMVNIPGLYFLKLYQHRSYVLALRGADLPAEMFVDEQQTGLSFRSYGDLLLLGGGDHKTGKPGGNYQELAAFAAANYPQAEIKYRWATQDCMTLDGVPYIGRHRNGSQNLYVATGFNKWGMTGSMAASRLLCDLIAAGKSELESLYSPQRSIMTKQLAINIGSAAVGLMSPGGPRCSHMGCKLKKNSIEGTWDCPCHGSRFNEEGHVIDNPAKRESSHASDLLQTDTGGHKYPDNAGISDVLQDLDSK